MVNQLLAGVHIASAAEGIAFGARLGLNTRLIYDIVSCSSGSSWLAQVHSAFSCNGGLNDKTEKTLVLGLSRFKC